MPVVNRVGNRAVIGVSDHAGWAILVTVAGDRTLVDRRRVELVARGLPTMPYHHDAQGLPLEEATDVIERVRASAERHARLAFDAVAAAVHAPIVGVTLRECQPLPPTIAERLSNYRAQNVADWVMYRRAIAAAAEVRGWDVHWYNAKKVPIAAGDAIRRSIGPPWTVDHKIAMAAALAVQAATSR